MAMILRFDGTPRANVGYVARIKLDSNLFVDTSTVCTSLSLCVNFFPIQHRTDAVDESRVVHVKLSEIWIYHFLAVFSVDVTPVLNSRRTGISPADCELYVQSYLGTRPRQEYGPFKPFFSFGKDFDTSCL